MAEETTKIKSLLDNIERVAIDQLKTHPRNPRKGDVDRIAASLDANAQYRPIVVQKKTGYIIAGNHTYLGARKLGWTHVDAVTIDVNDKAARKIMLADNRTSDAGTYDDNILAEVLRSLEGDIEGTGYYDAEIDSILSGAQEAATETLREFESSELQREFNDAPLGSEDEAEILSESDGDEDFEEKPLAGGDAINPNDPSIEGAGDMLTGMFNLKNPDEVEFPKLGYWGIVELDQKMMMRFDELPEKLVTWAESFSRQKIDPHANDPETWWLFPWGMSSSQGMEKLDQVIPCFYSPDSVFENWWNFPERYASKCLNSGIKYIVGPDFSMYGKDPKCIQLWQLYRQRWLSRYLQECGLKVIPNVECPVTEDLEFLKNYVLATLPVGLPMIALQMQTWNKQDVEENGGIEHWAKHYNLIFETLKPKGLLLYAGKPGKEFFDEHVKTNCPVRYIESRLTRLSQFDRDRKMKKTI